ncbi:ankyrin repeat-containing domain protein [Peziza echinospora]|nr:ankyrin repeat-containing domain protein [Peziza echinospora]
MIDVSIRLRRAIILSDLLLVKRILKNHPNSLHNPDHTSSTSLHLASEIGSLPIVTHLIDDHSHEAHGISRNNDGDTPLMVACQHNNIEVVEFLCRRFPKSVDWRNKCGWTSLMVASRWGNEGVVKVLLEVGRVRAVEGEDGVGMALGEDDGGWRGAGTGGGPVDIDAVDGNGCTALHFASAYGHLKTIRTLIDHGASTYLLNRNKWTAEQFSFSFQAEQYFRQLVAEKEKRDALQHMQGRSGGPARAATPVFGRSERAVMVGGGRQRASSGS